MAAIHVSASPGSAFARHSLPNKRLKPPNRLVPTGDLLSAGKKLLDTSHPAFKAVSSVRSRLVNNYWRGITLPYPDPGVRLIRRAMISLASILRWQPSRHSCSKPLRAFGWRVLPNLRAAARQRLGSLYNGADYPHSLTGLFAVEWDYPSLEPPSYLRQLSPELFGHRAHKRRSTL